MFYLFIILTISISIGVNGQSNIAYTSSTEKKHEGNYNEEDSTKIESSNVTVSALPFALYSEIFGWAVGGFIGVQGLSQSNMSLYAGGLISTNGTK